MILPYFDQSDFVLYHNDCNDVFYDLNTEVDCVFADPPYFLSNDGLTIQNGEIVSVNKGQWDKLNDESVHEFNSKWLRNIRKVMKPNATIWISGTMHNIFSIHRILEDLEFKILNVIIWEKTNPPPNYSCRYFTHSSEIIIWARKEKKTSHFFNYDLVKQLNGGKQMKDVWKLPAIAPWEKKNGKHPTQKPLSILSRVILSSTKAYDICLDPFTGSSTTGIASNLFNRRFIGIDIDEDFLNISIKRWKELQSVQKSKLISKISGLEFFENTYLPFQ